MPEVPCRAQEVKKSIFGTFGGGWMNGSSVGLDPQKRILGCPSAWLMRIRLVTELSTPKIWGGGVGTSSALPGSRGEKTHFRHRFRGGVEKQKFCHPAP